MTNVLAVFVGGATGALLRYWINVGYSDFEYPVGTLLENLIGSFVLGVLSGIFLIVESREWLKLGLGVGLCGGFTTMSTFGADAFHLWKEGLTLEAASYVSISVIGGIALASLGLYFGSKAVVRYRDFKRGGAG